MHRQQHALRSGPGGGNRKRILDVLNERPGLCFRALLRATGLAAGTVRHHLPTLERRGLITTIQHGQRILHFPGDEPPGPEQVRVAVLRDLDEAWRAVYDVAATHPEWPQKRILDALPEQNRSTAQHRLRRLVELGLLEERRVGLWGVAYVPGRLVGE